MDNLAVANGLTLCSYSRKALPGGDSAVQRAAAYARSLPGVARAVILLSPDEPAPEGFEPVTAIALGYLGEPEMLDEKNRERELTPRTRRPLADFVFEETWGQTAALSEV